jgi:hypothetical protein
MMFSMFRHYLISSSPQSGGNGYAACAIQVYVGIQHRLRGGG